MRTLRLFSIFNLVNSLHISQEFLKSNSSEILGDALEYLPSFTTRMDMMFPSDHNSYSNSSMKLAIQKSLQSAFDDYSSKSFSEPESISTYVVLRGIILSPYEEESPSVVLALSLEEVPSCSDFMTNDSSSECSHFSSTDIIKSFVIDGDQWVTLADSDPGLAKRDDFVEAAKKNPLKRVVAKGNRSLLSLGLITIQELNRMIFSRSLDLKNGFSLGEMDADVSNSMTLRSKDYFRFWRKFLSAKESKIFLFPLSSSLSAIARDKDLLRKRSEMDYNEVVYAFYRMDDEEENNDTTLGSNRAFLKNNKAGQIVHNPMLQKREDDCVPVTWYNVFHHCIFGKPRFCHV